MIRSQCPGGGRWTCDACPVQAEGTLSDGRMWYFRGRHGYWEFRVSEEPTTDVMNAVCSPALHKGADPDGGFMTAQDASRIIGVCLDDVWRDAGDP